MDSTLYQTIIKQFFSDIDNNNPNAIALGGLLGSRLIEENYSQDSDLDLLLIFQEPPKADPTNSLNIISVKRTIEETLLTFNLGYIQVVPTFRVEDIIREFSKSEIFLLHLLTYPSLDIFKKIEQPSLIRSVGETLRLYLGSETLLENLKNYPLPPFKERIIPLLNLLGETYFFMIPGKIGSNVVTESLSKLKYVLKYVLVEIYIGFGYNYKEALNWQFIFDKLDMIPLESSIVERVYNLKGKEITLEVLEELYRDSYSYINHILLWSEKDAPFRT